MGEVIAFRSADELAEDYRVCQQRDRTAAKMRRQIDLLEREERDKPEFTIGIVNDDGQLEVIQAKPVGKNVKMLPELFCLGVILFGTFAFLENIGV
jgi:hypothetical protein